MTPVQMGLLLSGYSMGLCALLAGSAGAAAAQSGTEPTSAVACRPPEAAAGAPLSDSRLRLQRQGGKGMALMAKDGQGAWRPVVVAATQLEPEATVGPALALRVAWCGDRAATINGQLYRFDMLPIASEAPADVLIEQTAKGWSAALPPCAAAKLNAPAYRFDPAGWSLTVGQRAYPLDRETQEEFVFTAPTPTKLDQDDVPDALLRYEERVGSGRQAFVAALLGCGDGSYVLVGSVSLGPVGSTATVSGSYGAGQALSVSSRSNTVSYGLDQRTRALIKVQAKQ